MAYKSVTYGTFGIFEDKPCMAGQLRKYLNTS